MAPLSGDDPRHLGGFRVLTLLAVGGMGRVYLALGPDRRAVALKVARPEFAADDRFRVRFRRGRWRRLRKSAGRNRPTAWR